MQLPAALVLSLVRPVDAGRSRVGIGDRNHCPLAQGFRLQTVDDVGHFFGHAVPVISLGAAPFGELPFIVVLLRVVPSHVLGGVVVEGALWKEIRFDRRGLHRNVRNDADEIPHDEFAAPAGLIVSYRVVSCCVADCKVNCKKPCIDRSSPSFRK